MNFKKLVLFSINFGLLILFTNCSFFRTTKKKSLSAESSLMQLDSLLIQLQQLTDEDCKNLEQIVDINEKMRRIVEDVRSIEKFDTLVEIYSTKEHRVTFTFSDNRQIAVFSWNTQMHCLGHNIKNIALYKSKDKMVASSLYGESMIYDTINVVQNGSGHMVYLFNGETNSQKSVLKGYAISNGALVQASIPSLEKAYVNNTFE